MPKIEKITQTVEDLRVELAQAKQREAALAREASDLPNRLQDLAREAVREKAAAARAGGALLAVATEAEIQELRDRQESVTLERWAAALHSNELAVKQHELEEKQAYADEPAAVNAHKAAERKVAEAQAVEQEAYGAMRRVWGRQEVARKGKRDAEREIQELEAQYPGA